MGVSYCATLVAGTRLDNVAFIDSRVEMVDKFDEDTGNQIRRPVKRHRLLIAGKEVPIPDETSPNYWVEELLGLEVFSTGEAAYRSQNPEGHPLSRYDFSQFVVGVKLAEVGERGMQAAFTRKSADEAMGEVAAKLHAIGAQVAPILRLIMYVG